MTRSAHYHKVKGVDRITILADNRRETSYRVMSYAVRPPNSPLSVPNMEEGDRLLSNPMEALDERFYSRQRGSRAH